jgi:hypothetical protein
VNERIEIHPSTGPWIGGARFGTVVGARTANDGTRLYHVRLDDSASAIWLPEMLIAKWLEGNKK